MSAIRVLIQPCDNGLKSSTSLVNGSIADGVIQVTAAESGALNDFITLIRSGSSTAAVVGVLALNDDTPIVAYCELEDKELADAAITIENMSPTQKAALLAYIAAISAEADTSSVETAIAALE